ncbi:glycosyltransferase family 2 protein [Maribellus sediminis]|uniref:glycosyltransferase family 2 protein n=1 Tax=Maribellus sediminis TaxID=2696285 RepID=UPI0014317B41|nr:glycosyltransferase family 2 protein [Maribellus sediminis]
MKSIAVLLTVFNRKENTLNCLHHLLEQNLPRGYILDVYLVNDGCTDGTPDAVKEQFPDVHIIEGNGNLFWNRGMHLAWQTAAEVTDYDFYLWLNDDTILFPNAMTTLLESSAEKQHNSIIVGTTSAIKNTEHITYGGRRLKKGLLHPNKEIQSCDYFNGNIVLIPQSVYQKVGTNDPMFKHALGDFDYGLRARKMGVQSFIAPGILGHCNEHECLSTWCNPDKSFKQRWKVFRSPLGQNPEEYFLYEKRHNGLLMACFHYLTNHLRVICPWLWKLKN